MPPVYSRYKVGQFANVTTCQNMECGLIALREDMHPIDPCPDCGARVSDTSVSAKWIPPVYKGVGFWRKKISDGYWKFAEQKR